MLKDRLRKRLADKEMSPAELARIADVNEGVLSRILSGKSSRLQIKTKVKLAEAIGVDPEWFEEDAEGTEGFEYEKDPLLASIVRDVRNIYKGKESLSEKHELASKILGLLAEEGKREDKT